MGGTYTCEMLQMASCPLDVYLDNYITARDRALSEKDPAIKRYALMKVATKAAVGFEVLCNDLKLRIHANDELLFKGLLLFVNLLTCLGQYVYNDFINPERVYRCKF